MLTDDGYRQIMQHARRLAQGGRGELAQHLRDAIDLRAEVEALRDANERLNVAVAEAERIVRAYARRNPRHEYKGVIQDPFGAHGWLDRFDAARAAQGERG